MVCPQPSDTMNDSRFIITADRRHFRVYEVRQEPGQRSPELHLVNGVDLTYDPRGQYAANESDQAGRFPGSQGTLNGGAGPTGQSIDERLPLQEEYQRRVIDDLVNRIETFLATAPNAGWFFAAGPDLHQRVLDRLSPAVSHRLQQALAKELANVPLKELLSHFELSAVR